MKLVRKALLVCLVVIVVFAGTFWIPSSVVLAGPSSARLEGPLPAGAKLGVIMDWWDRILNSSPRVEHFPFDSAGQVALPDFRLDTSVGRRLSKWILTTIGLWPGCEHCDGPSVYGSLYQVEQYSPPKGMRLVEGQYERDDTIVFTVELLPDETQFETRSFAPTNPAALIEECRQLIAKGDDPSIDPAAFGPEIRRVDPVRVESTRGVIILWMGGSVGYGINPDSDGLPGLNFIMMSGTDTPGIHRLERMGDPP
jgi:hypothetical protein